MLNAAVRPSVRVLTRRTRLSVVFLLRINKYPPDTPVAVSLRYVFRSISFLFSHYLSSTRMYVNISRHPHISTDRVLFLCDVFFSEIATRTRFEKYRFFTENKTAFQIDDRSDSDTLASLCLFVHFVHHHDRSSSPSDEPT